MLAQQLTEISTTGVLLLVANVILMAVGGIVAWSSRRLVRENDERHRELGREIAALAKALADEREARHAADKEANDRLWAFAGDVKENYARQREVMSLHGTLVRQMNENHHETLNAIGTLPCRRGPDCATGAAS